MLDSLSWLMSICAVFGSKTIRHTVHCTSLYLTIALAEDRGEWRQTVDSARAKKANAISFVAVELSLCYVTSGTRKRFFFIPITAPLIGTGISHLYLLYICKWRIFFPMPGEKPSCVHVKFSLAQIRFLPAIRYFTFFICAPRSTDHRIWWTLSSLAVFETRAAVAVVELYSCIVVWERTRLVDGGSWIGVINRELASTRKIKLPLSSASWLQPLKIAPSSSSSSSSLTLILHCTVMPFVCRLSLSPLSALRHSLVSLSW